MNQQKNFKISTVNHHSNHHHEHSHEHVRGNAHASIQVVGHTATHSSSHGHHGQSNSHSSNHGSHHGSNHGTHHIPNHGTHHSSNHTSHSSNHGSHNSNHGSHHVPNHGTHHSQNHATSHRSGHGSRQNSTHRSDNSSNNSQNGNSNKNACSNCCLHSHQDHKNIEFPVKNEVYDYQHNDIDQLLQYNKNWSNQIQQKDPTYFAELAKHQSPEYLWIGCSDSRIPVERLVGLGPGEMFVHRNIANQIIYTDINCLSVIQYAVDVLKVKHIIVCGHYQCGGVKASIDNPQIGIINNWICHIREIYNKYKKELQQLENQDLICDKLVELNLIKQVYNIGTTNILQNAWSRGQEITVHGWIYGLKDGKIKEIGFAANSNHVLEEVHEKMMAKVLSQISEQSKKNGHKEKSLSPQKHRVF